MAATKNITANNRLSAALVVIAGIVLLSLALPRMLSAVVAWEGRNVLWDVRHGKVPSVEPLISAGNDFESASRLTADGVMDVERGLLLMVAASSMGDTAAVRKEQLAAVDALTRGLSMAPAQPEAWFHLAWLKNQLGDRTGAIPAFRMSLLSGPVYPFLATTRLELGLQLLSNMDADLHALMARQVRLTWMIDPNAVTVLAADHRYSAFLSQALNQLSPEEMKTFKIAQEKLSR